MDARLTVLCRLAALVDPETGKYLLNGNFIVTLSQKGLIYEGVALDYSGAVEVVERLNCTRMLNRELIVQVRPSRAL